MINVTDVLLGLPALQRHLTDWSLVFVLTAGGSTEDTPPREDFKPQSPFQNRVGRCLTFKTLMMSLNHVSKLSVVKRKGNTGQWLT